MLIQNISTRIAMLLITVFILSLSSCSVTQDKANGIHQIRYKYPHQCTKGEQVINHYITAKVPLTADEIKLLKPTLQESFKLDYDSCVFVGDLNDINQQNTIQ
jgi:hypothetical protein